MKLTKQQRRNRRKRNIAERKKRRALKVENLKKKPQQWVAPKYKMFSIPNIFPSGLSMDKRIDIIRSIGTKAKKDFVEKYPAIKKWFKEYDALYILSYLSYYLVAHVEGIDPEAFGEDVFYHHYLEVMQALALCQERNFSGKPLMREGETLREEMKAVGQLMTMRLLNIPENIKTEKELSAFRLRTGMMNETTAVRNWAYPHQLKKTVLDLAKLISTDFKLVYNIDPFDLMQMLFKLTEERAELLNSHRRKIRNCIRKDTYQEIINAYNEAFPENEKIEGEEVNLAWERAGKNKKNLAGMLLCHSDLKLERIYSFTIEHAKSFVPTTVSLNDLKSILKKLTMNFGDLKDHNLEHIILDNPTHHKPFIQVNDDTLFSSIWGIMPHMTLDLLEDLIWENIDLRDKYLTIKAKYLEDQVEAIFKKHFPTAKTYRGSYWTDPATGKTYENDLLVIIDTFAIVVEEKSGRINDAAKRGAESLFEELRKLIEEPSEQALRFVNYLKNNKKLHTFLTKKGEHNSVDNSKINYYIPLGVTFSNLGIISSNLKKLIEAGVVNKTIDQLVPSISFTDLEVVFELLNLEAEKVHYLSRRREFEAHLDYEGDELDLLAFYLDNGFNIGEEEYSKNGAFGFTLKSKELDPYMVGKYEGVDVIRPELAMTKWWKDLLNIIEERKVEGWLETSLILLNSTKDDQEKFEEAIKTLKSNIDKGRVKKPHNWALFITGPERRRYAIAYYPYTTNDKNLRNNIISKIFDEQYTSNCRGVAVIGVNLTRNDYPYSVLVRKMSTDLFDSLNI